MGKLRVLSGKEVCAILERHGYAEVRRRGSHIVMQRVSDDGATTTVPVPDLKEVKKGTLRRALSGRSATVQDRTIEVKMNPRVKSVIPKDDEASQRLTPLVP